MAHLLDPKMKGISKIYFLTSHSNSYFWGDFFATPKTFFDSKIFGTIELSVVESMGKSVPP